MFALRAMKPAEAGSEPPSRRREPENTSQTFANPCVACSDAKVLFHVKGPCGRSADQGVSDSHASASVDPDTAGSPLAST